MMVDGDNHDVLGRDQIPIIFRGSAPVSPYKSTTVSPEHYSSKVRRRTSLGNIGCLDNEEQAVLSASTSLSSFRPVPSTIDGLPPRLMEI